MVAASLLLPKDREFTDALSSIDQKKGVALRNEEALGSNLIVVPISDMGLPFR